MWTVWLILPPSCTGTSRPPSSHWELAMTCSIHYIYNHPNDHFNPINFLNSLSRHFNNPLLISITQTEAGSPNKAAVCCKSSRKPESLLSTRVSASQNRHLQLLCSATVCDSQKPTLRATSHLAFTFCLPAWHWTPYLSTAGRMHLARALGNSCACAMMLTIAYTTCRALAAGSRGRDPCPASSPLLDSKLSVWLWWELAIMRLRVNRITDSVHSFISSACTVQPVDQSSASVNNHSPVSRSVNINIGCSLTGQSCQHSHQMFPDCTVLSTFTLDSHCLQSCQHSYWIFSACSPVNIHTGYSVPAVLSTFTLDIHCLQSCQYSHGIYTDCSPVNIHTGYSPTAVLSIFTLDIHWLQSCQHSHWIFTDCSPVNIHTGYSLTAYPVNMPDPIQKHFLLWPLMAIMDNMQSESGWIVYAGSDFPHLFQFCFSKEGMDHIVQNRPRSDLDGLVRVWPNTSGLKANWCAGIIWPGFSVSGRMQLACYQFLTFRLGFIHPQMFRIVLCKTSPNPI